MTDTDDKIQRISESTERRISDLYRQNRDDFAELKGIVKDTNTEIVNTRLEVVAIKASIEGLATKTQLMESISTVKDWSAEQLKQHDIDHMIAKHKSKAPPPDSKSRVKTVVALVSAIVALTVVIVALAKLL